VRLSVLLATLAMAATARADSRTLRVCSDPNNLPFSGETRHGFENEIAEVLAKELGAKVEYTWWAQRRGFFGKTLKAERCDVVIGVPVGLGMARTTAPYYRSSYVFVTRADRKLGNLRSLDDERLHSLRIGVQLVGDDGANSPPAHALGARGIVDNVVGFTAYSDYRKDSPATAILRAVADGTIDVAIAWGPLAGGFAKMSKVKLAITPVSEATDHGLPMQFSIALGVRRGDKALAAELDRALVARAKDIRAILTRWGVPQP
jgi:quinoprotein dehydrogenase-associated probable ABC transporter substrate-binding protein